MEKADLYSFCIGMEAPEVVVGLIQIHPEIKFVKFQEYEPHVLGVTQELKEKTEVPVKTLIRHHPDVGEYVIGLERKNVTSDKIRDLIDKANTRRRAFVLCSRVETNDDDVLHIPMLDFECAISDKNLAKILEFIAEMNDQGLVLESGRSYHYYSFNLLQTEKWEKFMYRTGLFTGFIDSRHINHRLLSKEARLRLAKIEGSDRYIMTPKVVSIKMKIN